MIDRVLVTGGAGFFGHHFVEHLLKTTEVHVIVLDSLNYASYGFDRLRDVRAYDDRRVQRYVHSLVTPFDVGLRREIGKVDYIVHLAAETHVDNSISNPRPFLESNIIGTFNLLEYARSLDKLKAFIYFSTDEVYGPACRTSKEELYTHNPALSFSYREWNRFNPTNPYSATKAAGECLALAWANSYGLPLIITHCMNIFGERQHPEKFIPHVIRSVLRGDEVLIHTDPEGKPGSRYYIHARNVAAALLHILRNSDAKRDQFNITGEEELDNLELANAIADYMRSAIKVRKVDFHSSRPGHDLRYALDGNKLARLGWKPPVTFEASLKKTVEWYLANPHWLENETNRDQGSHT